MHADHTGAHLTGYMRTRFLVEKHRVDLYKGSHLFSFPSTVLPYFANIDVLSNNPVLSFTHI